MDDTKTLTVEKTNKDLPEETTRERLERLNEEAQEYFESLKKKQEELSDKKYLVDGGSKTQEIILSFLDNEAKWKSHEALGVIKAFEETEKGLKNKELFLSGLCIEAIAYYVDKVEGAGLKSAKRFSEDLFKPVNEVYGKVQYDRQELKKLQEKLAEYEKEISFAEAEINQGLDK